MMPPIGWSVTFALPFLSTLMVFFTGVSGSVLFFLGAASV